VSTGGKAAEFARQIAEESQANARIIRAANIKLD
ncbi:MAG: tripartite tricarboxylate transporter substrate binding protein, partial [Comamonas sp.]